jgi:hypothetical protein
VFGVIGKLELFRTSRTRSKVNGTTSWDDVMDRLELIKQGRDLRRVQTIVLVYEDVSGLDIVADTLFDRLGQRKDILACIGSTMTTKTVAFLKKDSTRAWVDFRVEGVAPRAYTFKSLGNLMSQMDLTLEKLVGALNDVQSTMSIKVPIYNNHPLPLTKGVSKGVLNSFKQ